MVLCKTACNKKAQEYKNFNKQFSINHLKFSLSKKHKTQQLKM